MKATLRFPYGQTKSEMQKKKYRRKAAVTNGRMLHIPVEEEAGLREKFT